MEWLDFWQQHSGREALSTPHETIYWVVNARGRVAVLRQWYADEDEVECDYWIPDPQTDELLPSTLSQFVRLDELTF